MKNENKLTLYWHRIVNTIFFITIGINTAYARNPIEEAGVEFKFVEPPKLARLGNLEVQEHEFTFAQWNAIDDQLPVEHQSPWKNKNCSIENSIDPNLPVVCVSYLDVQALIDTLNEQDTNYDYRLLTRTEFETLVEVSLLFIKHLSNNDLSRYAWFLSLDRVLKFKANKVCSKESIFGLCDILGNVSEWTTEYEWEWVANVQRGSYRTIYGGDINSDETELRFHQSWVQYAEFYRRSITTTGFRLVRVAK